MGATDAVLKTGLWAAFRLLQHQRNTAPPFANIVMTIAAMNGVIRVVIVGNVQVYTQR